MNYKNLFAVVLLFVLCTSVLAKQQKTINDALGFPYTPSFPPKKIISLAPNITEILFSLDLEKEIIGVTRYCDYPEQVREKEKIGGLIDLSLEKIKALNPDLIIGFRGNPLKVINRLRSLHLPVFVLEMGANLDSIFSIIEDIGTITHKKDKAGILIRSLKKKYEKIRSALQNVKHEPKIFLSLQGTSFWTCGEKSFLNDLIKKAKGVNIAGDIPRNWLFYNREQFIHENPDIIVILSKSQEEFITAKEWFKKESHVEETKAIITDSIYFVDENLVSRPGPRLIDAFEELARLLHPQCFETKL